LEVLVNLLGDHVRHLEFLSVKDIEIPGVDAGASIELSRIGMAGTLAYEVRGPIEY
jgi:glycine cleavage system aminomethyltransferase T